MSRVTTKTGIANLSASLLKVAAVTNIDPPDSRGTFAKIANQWYDESRRDTLADHTWNFAETEVTLAAEPAAPVAGRFGVRYLLPADYVRIAWIGDEAFPEKDYKIKKGYIYCNIASPLQIGYIFDQEDILQYSPKFIQTFARKLAANCAYDLTGNRTFAAEMEKTYIEYLSVATTVDGQESPPTHKIRRSRWKEAKEGFSMNGSVYQGRVVT